VPNVGLNNMSGRWRQFVKRLHPEGISWPGSVLYNAIDERCSGHPQVGAADRGCSLKKKMK
jgi:hypothetical protein